MSPPEVVLREVVDDDLPLFYEDQADPVAYTMADFKSRDREAFMAHWARIRVAPQTWIRTITVDGQVVGHVMSFPRDGVQELGYWISRPHWGRGYASAALAQFLPLIPIRPLFAGLAKSNLGSQRVLEKCGFKVILDQGGYLTMWWT